MKHEYVFLTEAQLTLLGHVAEGLNLAAIAERRRREKAEVRAQLSDIQDALGARSLGEAILIAATRGGLRASEALAEDVAAARAAGPLSEPLRLLVGARAAGATLDALAKLLGGTPQQSLRLAALAGLHRPSLSEAELELLRHAARGHAADRCMSECGLPGKSPIGRQRTAILRKLEVPDMTAAVAVAIRDLGLEPPPEFTEQIARLRRDGLPARVREVVRDISFGATRDEIARNRGLTVSQIGGLVESLSTDLGLKAVSRGMREVCTVAIVVSANPGDQDPATLEPALGDTTVSVLHWVALGHDVRATAGALGLRESAVHKAHRRLYSVFDTRSLLMAAARATKLGVLTLPSSQDEPRRRLREQQPYREQLQVFELMLEGLEQREIAERIGWPLSTVKSAVRNLCDAIGVRTTINALVLLIDTELVQPPPFNPDLDPPGRPLRRAPGTEPEPWAALESARGRDDRGE